MNSRKIKKILTGLPPHMVGNGFRVSNYLPGPNQYNQETSPFIMLDYNAPVQVAPSNEKLGVGEHPHRGFETVTIVKNGSLAHRDSSGGGGEINTGDVQWMTAGSGVLHEEFFSEAFMKTGGTQHFMQLWVNLPAKYKMTAPAYQNIAARQIPNLPLDDQGSQIRIIAGEYRGTRGPARTFTPINLFDVRLVRGGRFTVSLPSSQNTMVLINEGKVQVNGSEAATGDFILFEHSEGEIIFDAEADTNLTVFSGEPLNEPIASYGPFVMNTKQEIVQALEDFKSGKFGTLSNQSQNILNK